MAAWPTLKQMHKVVRSRYAGERPVRSVTGLGIVTSPYAAAITAVALQQSCKLRVDQGEDEKAWEA